MIKIKEPDVHIYLVDDDEMILKLLKTKFEASAKYKLSTFSNGEAFFQYFTNNHLSKKQVHIVILDYFLREDSNPDGKNGLEILKRIKDFSRDAEVIMLSGADDVDIATLAMKNGAVSFVKKNDNAFLRVQNNIKYILSEKSLQRTHRASLSTRRAFLVAVFVVLALIVYYVVTEVLPLS